MHYICKGYLYVNDNRITHILYGCLFILSHVAANAARTIQVRIHSYGSSELNRCTFWRWWEFREMVWPLHRKTYDIIDIYISVCLCIWWSRYQKANVNVSTHFVMVYFTSIQIKRNRNTVIWMCFVAQEQQFIHMYHFVIYKLITVDTVCSLPQWYYLMSMSLWIYIHILYVKHLHGFMAFWVLENIKTRR